MDMEQISYTVPASMCGNELRIGVDYGADGSEMHTIFTMVGGVFMEALSLPKPDYGQWRPAAWVMPTDLPGINRAERIKSLEMAAERVTPEPAKPATPAGLCVVAGVTHKLGGWNCGND